MKTPIETAVEVFGSQTALAKAIGTVPQVVNNWLRRKNVPAEYCPAIERATGGRVVCETLRPDVDWAYLRATNCGSPKVGAGETTPETHQEAA